jgi:hypothetical protein
MAKTEMEFLRTRFKKFVDGYGEIFNLPEQP